MLKLLEEITCLLIEFGIKSKVDFSTKAVEICGRENLISFAREISFSQSVSINPKRKNSIWKNEIEKRKILDMAISSYVVNR